ncbi:3-methyl-2-oxobutanoate hydroxymethyltransferase [Oleiphilus messinensis]|uniref:3-methyl-2-oxobutanoate hydroxymethyltransferase n=1 Tax=Oleiphilus messinensis TaxID=141451 RepID=A0A1Y0IEK1_9GAMM|nr:3-methyl-2-oxobutanoate hydroxymethyltransferase [Oleiphilus messinensis]ARU58599.1 3-methyl-2-oxobutanoate hydroxymethyltransferase [Oleiphilus messinensis]
MATTIQTLHKLKTEREKFSCLTAYDATFAHAVSTNGVDVILVGDSLGMVLQGEDSTLPVTMEDMIYHVQCVKNGNQGSLIMADMPFMSYATPEAAMANAAELMQAGAHMVKLEGGDWLCETIALLSERGIPVCGHLGLTPQWVNKFGGYKVQGREDAQAEQILEHAQAMVESGADLILVECIPTALGKKLAETLPVPVIGIGAGPNTDAQVLVIHDMLGISTGRRPRFVKDFLAGSESIASAIQKYVNEVKAGDFPGPEHGFE